MGIPHLITFLRPYAELESLSGHNVIIDGPGLCYQMHYSLLGRRTEARNSFEAAPSYEELAEAAIEWLNGLRESGAVVRRIYFDGFLPHSKLNTRLKRLESSTKQAVDYYHTHSIPCRAPLEDRENRSNNSQSIFGGQSPRSALNRLPPPPFLVPAILEALKFSKEYITVTEVVPGEADLYCARYVREHGGVVFTGDSDLLVHDLGPSGAVSFFKDIEMSSEGNPHSLRTLIYRPTAIANRLDQPKSHGLLALAFEMSIDNHGTFPKLLSQAAALKAVNSDANSYQEFCREYIPPNAEARGSLPAKDDFRYLDPRISEIVLQFPAIAKLSGQDSAARTPTQDPLRVFLPFLLDCPIRTSAWEMSTSIRQLAYGLINLAVPEDQQRSTVVEHRRQQNNARGREWQLPTPSEIPDACIAIGALLTQLENILLQPSTSDLWLAVAIAQEMEWSSSLDKVPLSPIVVEQLFHLQEKHHKICTWDIIHFLAQIQGSYYSFRILKKILGLIMSHEQTPELPDAVRLLSTQISSLPGIRDVPDLSKVTVLYRKIEKRGTLRAAHEITGIEEPTCIPPIPVAAKRARKKRKRKGGDVLNRQPSTKMKIRNPFELLDQE